MQTIGFIPLTKAGPVHNQPGPNCLRIEFDKQNQKKKNYSAQRCCNSFLTEAVSPVFSPYIHREWKGINYNYITQSNYDFLKESYFRYADLLRVKGTHIPDKLPGNGIYKLYNDMKALVGADLNVNIDIHEDRLCFTLWKPHQWGEYELYWFPVKFLENLNVKLRRISISFLHNLIHHNHLYTTNLYETREFVTNWMLENEDEDTTESSKLIHSYDSGKIYRLMSRIEKKSYYKRLSTALRKYQPQNEFEHSLIELLVEGLQFTEPHGPAILSYEYDPFYEEEGDIPLALYQQIAFIYDAEDPITSRMEEWVNCILQESYALVPITTLQLSPLTETLFTMDNYPERFFRWADKFISLHFNHE